jgi:hypothetical protein
MVIDVISYKKALLFALAGAFLLAGCSTPPYQTAIPKSIQREFQDRSIQAAAPENAPRRAVAFCYSEMLNTPQDLMDEARLACGTGNVVVHDTDVLWTPCSLLQPRRATFYCTPGQNAGAAPPKAEWPVSVGRPFRANGGVLVNTELAGPQGIDPIFRREAAQCPDRHGAHQRRGIVQ